MSAAELSIARLSGVAEVTDSCSIFAPASTRARTTLSWPEFAAWWRAVHLNWSSKWTLALNRAINTVFTRPLFSPVLEKKLCRFQITTGCSDHQRCFVELIANIHWHSYDPLNLCSGAECNQGSPTGFQGIQQCMQIASMSWEKGTWNVRSWRLPALWMWTNWGWMGSMQ